MCLACGAYGVRGHTALVALAGLGAVFSLLGVALAGCGPWRGRSRLTTTDKNGRASTRARRAASLGGVLGAVVLGSTAAAERWTGAITVAVILAACVLTVALLAWQETRG